MRERRMPGAPSARIVGAAVALLATAAPAVGQEPPRVLDVVAGEARGATATLTVVLDRPGPAWVEYGSPGLGWFRIADTVTATVHRLVLARMEPGALHRWEVSAGADTVRGEVRAPPLPPEVAALGPRATGRPTLPLALLETGQRDGFRGLVAIDGAGRIAWYCDVGGIVHGAHRRRNGNWVVGDPRYGLREVTPECTFPTGRPRTPGRTIHHDLLEAPDGAILYLAREERTVGGDTLHGEFIRRWVPETGEDEEVWSSFDHLDPAADRGARSRDTNWLHANSLSRGPRGNLVMGLAHLDQVISIAPDLLSLEWRLGGPNATHPIVEGFPFSGQHTAIEIEPGRVLLFDNDVAGGRGWSRAVEYALGEGGAREVWAFRPPVDNWAKVVGSTWRLENGNTLVTFGANPRSSGSTGPMEVYEARPDGSVAWHLVLDGPFEMVYRATPLTTLVGEVAIER